MAGLPWIELSVDVPEHPKSLALAETLGDDNAFAYMIRLWTWCARTQHNGTFAGSQAVAQIERAAGWRGTRGRLLAAAVDVGFVEQSADVLVVHGWAERALAHMAKKERDAQRMVDYRARLKSQYLQDPDERNANVQRTFSAPPPHVHGNSNSNSKQEEKKNGAGSGEAPNADASVVPLPGIDPGGKRKTDTPRNPRRRALSDRMEAVWAETHDGDKYQFQRAKDGTALTKLLSYADDGEILRRWRKAITAEGFDRSNGIAEFCSKWNRYVAKTSTGPPIGQRFTDELPTLREGA